LMNIAVTKFTFKEKERVNMPDYIVMYGVQWCPDCSRARRVLKRYGIEYKEIDIDRESGAEAKMRSLNGGSGKVPTLIIGEETLIEPSDHDLTSALRRQGLIVEPEEQSNPTMLDRIISVIRN
jgi:glutaredoxin